jgi:hypothetical protein
MYCIVLYCIALRCVALRCVALHCIVLYCGDVGIGDVGILDKYKYNNSIVLYCIQVKTYQTFILLIQSLKCPM